MWFLYLTGRASIYILRTAFGLDWSERIRIIYAGDDNTDEDAMLVIIHNYFCFFDNFDIGTFSNYILHTYLTVEIFYKSTLPK